MYPEMLEKERNTKKVLKSNAIFQIISTSKLIAYLRIPETW